MTEYRINDATGGRSELRVGDTFWYKGERFIAFPSYNLCSGCYFRTSGACSSLPSCKYKIFLPFTNENMVRAARNLVTGDKL